MTTLSRVVSHAAEALEEYTHIINGLYVEEKQIFGSQRSALKRLETTLEGLLRMEQTDLRKKMDRILNREYPKGVSK